MNDAIYRIGNISIYGFGLLATISFLWGSFVFFKKAIDSHFEEFHVLDGIVMSAFWAFIVGRLSFVMLNITTFWDHLPRIFLFSNFPGIDKWGVILGAYLGIFWTARRVRAKFMDWFDLASLGILAGTAVFFAGLACLAYSWQYGLFACAYLLVFILAWNAEDKYRTFGWYKSNKTSSRSGLITGLTISTWGLLSLVETLLVFRQFSIGSNLWSVFLFVGGIVLVYIRSGRTATEDIKIIFKHGRK
ncbi:TPA: hypothetical protein DIU27_01915 [Candidatus Collierbacteria bacterium]|uniref:Prolipoprotein diacylglyceryl transferase n=1 Tax=Candidatus Collierbacteria bacterium GW2011_GWB2_44_22 TaxID=1618387 RepID=A0A0G1HY27_9BACT|nr:MAG: Prolipoprotein diacylglyceryl transferase [Candidatus Collierbacteria bacterium GW2011_GWA2_44_13]KKT50342.1 MAG: Prolipoprotein diacylglyceryl transferase [Candidatus Collierbacteria bacterium GW2011_GWB1_44_197]KKT52046.1 MAG: Prolipoprotein diacylglyceryl transferase [Candidatus Collierbacteria bacterium GW2011_GWB2_44_22]KKT62622.1 MAG: Prolipoprotein diacylglyceryl transferase [Candidatus Collierbacteria bacterium GW2011_GWD1_44_27]KKT66665.1 MAG: Prolipoprotein diacylglyceryl tran